MMHENAKDLLAAWLAQSPISELEAEVGELEGQHQEKQSQLDQLAKETRDLEVRLQGLRRAIEFIREADPSREGTAVASSGNGAPPATPASSSGDAPMTKTDLVNALLREHGPLWPREMRAKAQEKGWVSDDSAEGNRLAVAASRLHRRGRLEKREDERYAIPGQLHHPTGES